VLCRASSCRDRFAADASGIFAPDALIFREGYA